MNRRQAILTGAAAVALPTIPRARPLFHEDVTPEIVRHFRAHELPRTGDASRWLVKIPDGRAFQFRISRVMEFLDIKGMPSERAYQAARRWIEDDREIKSPLLDYTFEDSLRRSSNLLEKHGIT